MKNSIIKLNKVSKRYLYIFPTVLFFYILAIPVYAQTPTNFADLINNKIIGGILSPLVPLLIGLAVVVFIYGVLLLMLSQGGEKKEDGKKFMFWGIIGIFVMVSVWGLVAIVQNTFHLDNQTLTPIQMTTPSVTTEVEP